MAKKPGTQKSNNAQVQGFAEAARALECDESEARFDAALAKVAKHKPPDTDKPPKPLPKRSANADSG